MCISMQIICAYMFMSVIVQIFHEVKDVIVLFNEKKPS